VWALSRQSQEDAEKWKVSLQMPVKGQNHERMTMNSDIDTIKQSSI